MAHQQPDPSVTDTRHEDPVSLLQDLVRFDTTNPPGGERPCIEWIGELLDAYGISYETYAPEEERPSLVARIPGGKAAPLLLYGHVDVVPAEGDWTQPPFGGVLEDGYVWGRGTLDMKSGVAMFLAAFLDIASGDFEPAGDLILCVLSDEEAGGDLGAQFMVENHPEAFEGVEYALGEFGGFPMTVSGQRFYPIQVSEKQICWLEATFHGDGGHGSFPRSDDAMARMARFITALDGTRLPVHVPEPSRRMIEAIAAELDEPTSQYLESLCYPSLTDVALDVLDTDGTLFEPITHNVVNETIVSGGTKENVVPESVSLTLDCRLLPGHGPEDVIEEITEVVGDVSEHVTFDVLRFEAAPPETDMGMFETLAGVLEGADEEGVAIPYVLPAGTDARLFARLDIQTYGFTPLDLPDDFDFMELVHAPDERVPAASVEWGTERVREAILRYDGG